MYVNEPSEKAWLPEIEQSPELFDEPRHYSDFFYDDQPLDSGPRVGYARGVHTQVCRLDGNGNHLTMAKDCPHFDGYDEEGRIIQKGWTVQRSGT